MVTDNITGIVIYSVMTYLLVIVVVWAGTNNDKEDFSFSKLEWLCIIFAPITLPCYIIYLIFKGLVD